MRIPSCGGLDVQLWSLIGGRLAGEPLFQVGEQVGCGGSARFCGVRRGRIGGRGRRRSWRLGLAGAGRRRRLRGAGRRNRRRLVAGGGGGRRGAGVGSDDIDGLVAAERAEWIAKRLVGARTNFAVALQRRRRINARPRRRRAGDFIETCAWIAEQFLLRHCRVWFCRILGRLRRLRRRRAPLLALARGIRRRRLAIRSSRRFGAFGRGFPGARRGRTGAWLVGVLFWHAVDALLRLSRLLDLHRIEVAGDERFGVLVGSADDPQHKEEGHHRGHEIGEGDLPGAAVMLALMRAAAPDDDDFRMLRGHRRRSVGEPGEQLRPGAKRGHDLRGAGLDDDLCAPVVDKGDRDRQIDDPFTQVREQMLWAANCH